MKGSCQLIIFKYFDNLKVVLKTDKREKLYETNPNFTNSATGTGNILRLTQLRSLLKPGMEHGIEHGME